MLISGKESAHRNTANHSTTFSERAKWLQESTVCNQANTHLVCILTSEACSTHQYTSIRVNVVPFHVHTAGNNIKILVIKNHRNCLLSTCTTCCLLHEGSYTRPGTVAPLIKERQQLFKGKVTILSRLPLSSPGTSAMAAMGTHSRRDLVILSYDRLVTHAFGRFRRSTASPDHTNVCKQATNTISSSIKDIIPLRDFTLHYIAS